MAIGQDIYIEVHPDTPLPVGSIVHFRVYWRTESLYGRAVEWALIEHNLETEHPDFQVMSYSIDNPAFLFIEVKVVGPTDIPNSEINRASLLTGAMILLRLGIIALGIFQIGGAIKNYTVSLKTGAQTEYAQTTTAKLEAGSKLVIAAAILIVGVIVAQGKFK